MTCCSKERSWMRSCSAGRVARPRPALRWVRRKAVAASAAGERLRPPRGGKWVVVYPLRKHARQQLAGGNGGSQAAGMEATHHARLAALGRALGVHAGCAGPAPDGSVPALAGDGAGHPRGGLDGGLPESEARMPTGVASQSGAVAADRGAGEAADGALSDAVAGELTRNLEPAGGGSAGRGAGSLVRAAGGPRGSGV